MALAELAPLGSILDPVPAMITVHVVFAAAPHQFEVVPLRLAHGATAMQALRASGLGQRLGPAVLDGLQMGLWGRPCPPDAVLRDRDRLELLRPLVVDPKEARRQRYQRDGIKKRPSIKRPPRGA